MRAVGEGERGFIKAETASYVDYVELGGPFAERRMRTFRTCVKNHLAGV